MAISRCTHFLLLICLCIVIAARRSDVAHFSGQAKTPTYTNSKGKHAENLDTSRFASETAESEVRFWCQLLIDLQRNINWRFQCR
jgi:hypothetical protein